MDRVIGHDGYEDISKIYLDGLPIADLEGGTADVKIIEDLLAGRILKLKVHLESSQSEEMTNKHIIYLDCARQLLDHVIKLSFHYIEMNPQSLIADLGECLSLSIPHVDKIHLEAFYDKLITDYNDQGLLRHVISLLHYLLRNKVINGNYSTGLLSKVFQLLKDFDITCCFHVSSLLLPYMATDWESCQLIWKFIVSVRSQEVTTESQPLDVTLSVICCLVHFFILPIVKGAPSGDIQCSSDPLFDVRTSCVFWDMIQCGLADNFNPLNRKRSLYLLNCVLKSVEKVENLQADDFVFCWNSNDHDDIWGEKELKECWEDVILLLETLEEKQVHIVSPVMARLKKLLDATRNLINGHSALHVSWMLVIFKRIFAHDSKSIIKKGLKEIFSMDLTNSPFLTKDNWTELIDSLLTVFNNSSIFARECHSNSALTCPPLVSDLTKFLGRFTSELKSINDKSAFITDLLVALSLKCLPDIPMVYMSYSLSVVATSIKEPLLKSPSLTAIRSLISKCLLTHKLSQRTATQHFLLSIIIALIDPSVGFLEIFKTLGSFKASEVLIFQSQSWNQTCQCVRDIAIYPHVVGKLFSFLQDSIKCLLNPQTQTSLSPESIARAILLSVDSHMTSDINVSEGCSNEEVLSVLMFPFLESLDGALTRPYIPLDRIITSVKLLHSLLDQLLSGYVVSSQTVKENKINHLMYTCLLPWLPNVLSYFTEALLSGFHISSMSSQFDCICLYANTLGSLCHFLSLHRWVDCGSSLNGLAHKAVAVLVKYINNQTVVSLTCTLMGSISVLEWICVSGSTLMTQSEYVNLISQLSVLPVNLNIMRLPGGAADGVGSFVSSCLASYWNCFYHYLQVNPIVKSCDSHVTTFGSPDVESIAKVCVDHFDILGDHLHMPISCLTTILPQLILIKGVEYFSLIVENLWPLVLELKDHFKPFINAMTSFIQLVYHVIFLSSSDQTIINQQVKFAGEISILGETKAGVFYILIDHLSSVFLDMINNKEEDQSAHLIKRMDIMMTACCFGPIFKKNLRVILDVDQFLKTLNDSNDIYSFPLLHNNVPEDDLMVRVCAVTFLCKLSSTSCHASINFLSSFIEIIINKLDQLYTRGFHYTVNSYIHRCLLRLIQTLLVVYQWIEESTAMKVIAAILNYLEHDNQLSVRYSMEWLVILLIQRYSSHWRDFILPQLDMNSGKRLSRYCSVFTVVCKLGQCFSMTDQCVSSLLFTIMTCIVHLCTSRCLITPLCSHWYSSGVSVIISSSVCMQLAPSWHYGNNANV
jgi:hypothetical protein